MIAMEACGGVMPAEFAMQTRAQACLPWWHTHTSDATTRGAAHRAGLPDGPPLPVPVKGDVRSLGEAVPKRCRRGGSARPCTTGCCPSDSRDSQVAGD